ncbi:hypothetical protein AcV5_007312 [Taiwanofungus camphoratus]|nr:hypothetical protein AcV5_007312 [Antrodia cinnamomea]KAI0930654.1 hypothetical protein AcV5_007312 [Antrodia cinnamomea]
MIPLPTEVMYIIIEHNSSDVATLRASSLTCRSWLPASRRCLFHTVTLVDKDTLHRFSELIASADDIAHLVRELHVKAYGNCTETENWVYGVAPLLADKLVSLKSLWFSHVEWVNMCINDTFLVQLRRFAGVQGLSFSSCRFGGSYDFLPIVLAFPRLSHLSIDVVTWADDVCYLNGNPFRNMPSPQDSLPPCPLQLSSITIGRHCDPSKLLLLASWFPSGTCYSSLRSVAFDVVDKERVGIIGRLLRSLGPSLEHVRLGCDFSIHQGRVRLSDYIDISHNTGLRSLHIRLLDLQDHMMSWVPTLLSQISSTHLSQIVFDIWLWHGRQLRNHMWDRIEWILSHPRYACVKEVVFVHRGELDLASARNAIEARLSSVRQVNKIVRVRES